MARSCGRFGVRRLALVTAFAVPLTFVRRADATPSAKLTYARGSGAENCPDEADLRKAVAARLGYDPFFPSANKTVEANITRSKRGFHGDLKVIDAAGLVRGARSLDATSQNCADIVRALALAISIALDDFDVEAAPPSPTEPPAAEAPPASLESSQVPVAVTPDRQSAPHATLAPATKPGDSQEPPGEHGQRVVPSVWVAPVLSFGSAPAPAFGFHADLDLRYGPLSLGLEIQADLPASGGTSSQGQVATYLVLGSIAPCIHWPKPLFGCALLSAGGFQESGVDLAVPASQSAPFVAAGARLGAEVPFLGRYFLVAHGDALGVFTRHVVQIDGMTAFTVPPLLGRVGIGGGMRF